MALERVMTMAARGDAAVNEDQQRSRREERRGAGETQTEPDSESEASAEPSLDVIFDVLSNERRREVCRYLESESETTLGELAEHVAAVENDTTEARLSTTERKRVYVSLYQVHLPKMDDFGVIDYDEDGKTVRAKAPVTVIHDCLVAAEERTGLSDDPSDGLATTLRSVFEPVSSLFRS